MSGKKTSSAASKSDKQVEQAFDDDVLEDFERPFHNGGWPYDPKPVIEDDEYIPPDLGIPEPSLVYVPSAEEKAIDDAWKAADRHCARKGE